MFRQRLLGSRQTSIACMRACAHLSPMKCNHDRQAVLGIAEQPAAAGTVVSASMPDCRFPLVQHDEPRYSVFADGEAQQTLVWVTFKHDRKQVVSIAGCGAPDSSQLPIVSPGPAPWLSLDGNQH